MKENKDGLDSFIWKGGKNICNFLLSFLFSFIKKLSYARSQAIE